MKVPITGGAGFIGSAVVRQAVAAGHLVRARDVTYGLPAQVTNCSNNYAPFHFPGKLIPVVIRRALARDPIEVYGDGSKVRDWLFVEEHAIALLTVLRKGAAGRTYNIGGENEAANIDLVRMICAELGSLRDQCPSNARLELVVTPPPAT